jgi:hypothetical protein
MAEYHEFLYCSVLTPDQPITTVPRLLAQVRSLNARRQITGLLVFDGMRFCQHLEGPRIEAMALMERIARDPRHTQVQIVHQGPLTRRRYERFDMGFAEPDAPDAIADLHLRDGPAAVAHFIALRPAFDISG